MLIDRDFIRQHALFGKARRRYDRGGPGELRYGTRKSDKLVRCYPKPEVAAFRVEEEFHSRFLRAHKITKMEDLAILSLVPQHIRFVRMDWRRLRRHLTARFGRKRGRAVYRRARCRAFSVQKLCRYLRRMGVSNVHRLLQPISSLNRELSQAIKRWKVSIIGKSK